ncbi:MAG: hypothetical protein HRU19_27800 [Pseudobacteriovorax sp.]|nr:hypothetical protein [Pseudobacteriovorax sp.]
MVFLSSTVLSETSLLESTDWLKSGEAIGFASDPENSHLFQPMNLQKASFGHDPVPYWYRIVFKNDTNKATTVYFFERLAYTAGIEVYKNSTLLKKLQHKHVGRNRIVPIPLEANTEHSIYVKKTTEFSQRVTWKFFDSREKAIDHIQEADRSFHIIAAIFGMSLLFNIMLFVSYRSRVYTYYIAYLVFMFLLANWVWSNAYWGDIHGHYMGNIAGTSTYLFIGLFTIEFISLKKHFRNAYRLLAFFLCFAPILILLSPFYTQEVNSASEKITLLTNLICFVSASVVYMRTKATHVLIYLIAFGIMNVSISVQVLIWLGHINLKSNYIMFYGSAVENILMLLALGIKIYQTENERRKNHETLLEAHNELHHSYTQMAKVFYPHQLSQIKQGKNIEETMPVNKATACVICFDIVNSSQIDHPKVTTFMQSFFRDCHEIMMESYNGKSLQSKAFRIKEMGDGFLCSVGYPFRSPNANIAEEAYQLCLRFFEALTTEAKDFLQMPSIMGSFGIAIEEIQGFYPDSGTKEYGMFGRSLVLATRYESFRKHLHPEGLETSIITLQEAVYKTLSQTSKDDFTMIDLDEAHLSVRDDPLAHRVFVRYMGHKQTKQHNSLKTQAS